MPRKPRQEKQLRTFVVNEIPINVTLFPPTGKRKSWFVYWPGLKTSRSSGTPNFDDAVRVAERMIRNGGKRNDLGSTSMSDEEFREIQKAHFGRVSDPAAKARAVKSLTVFLEAFEAFKSICNLEHIAAATADDCAAFQRKALEKPKNWRMQHPKSKKIGVATISPSTVDKWSRSLQAAFERANMNSGKKCVRGVVAKEMLLTTNPWHHFTWISKRSKDIRHLSDEELLSMLDYFSSSWPQVPIVSIAVKICFWTWNRLSELTNIRWDHLRSFDGDYHFEIIGKWGVEKWARIPTKLFNELETMRVQGNPFIFAAYNEQLRCHHLTKGKPNDAKLVGTDFNPVALGEWLQVKIADWAKDCGWEHAHPHVIRKTSLQRARVGEDINRKLAEDARLGAGVMLASYVVEGDNEHRQRSDRMYWRLTKALPPNLVEQFGFTQAQPNELLKMEIQKAMARGDWKNVALLSLELSRCPSV